ncbi:MAG TPA: cytochrome c [Bacteroidia bacterium]|jgi:uncharacterized membrane protein SirB2|nr:cytochrome c [Bacteroidia bacterium]
MYKGIFYTHLISVNLFLLIYLIKTILLLAGKEDALAKFTKGIKVPEMIVSTLFLLTGIYMLTQIPVINTLLIIKIVIVFASIPLAVIGFKKKNKGLALASFIFIVGAYGLAEMSKTHTVSKPADDASTHMMPGIEGEGKVIDGEVVFESHCTSCHGEDGQLGLMGSPNLTESTLDLNSKIELIRKGEGAMQPFGGVLTDEEIQAVAGYVESLKK